MSVSKLPSKLGKEPLVDVVFEMRFLPSTMASVVLPGMFMKQLGLKGGEKAIERLPLYDMPAEVRRREHGMRYQPLLRIHWDNYVLIISDHSVGVACKIPYRGWSEFRQKIMDVVAVIKESEVAVSVERIALKYVDLIPGSSVGEQLNRLNVSVEIGKHKLKNESFNLRMEIPGDHALHVVAIGAPAGVRARDSSSERKGAIVDVDSLSPVRFENWERLSESLPDMLDNLHAENKAMFFECLKSETIEYLEPSYE
ncbi:hypothetical protein GCM10011533_01780 [Streptosporangium jomthongense]|uniref:TIGR04255 family protein n=1 Tax=Marinobacter aromaticivorans TaxID=1494078 RepID=A0ABW2IQL9_9GAMM|nr:TIGR04255 family protein [Marinobacter aromaticivorans]GGE53001.1 hypothetical protein GCM10011533_01780 [Streptosporangium jomthongense]